MSDKPEKLEIEFDDGSNVTATLLWDEAPQTCRAIVDALPAESDTLHAQWAGSELYFEDFPTDEDVPFENTTSRSEDFLLTNKISGGVLAFYVNPDVRSFCFVYDDIIPRRKVDTQIELNVFATIDDPEKAKEIGKRSRREGPPKMTVSVAG